MRASIRHVLVVPSEHSSSLHERLLSSDTPLAQDEGTSIDNNNTSNIGSTVGLAKDKRLQLKIHSQLDPDIEIQNLCVHPTEPILLYVTHRRNNPSSQRIIFQNYATRQTLRSLDVSYIVMKWMSSSLEKKTRTEKQQFIQQVCKDLGIIVSVQFVDEQVVFCQSAGRSSRLFSNPNRPQMQPYLIVQFKKVILLYRYVENSKSISPVEEINEDILNNSLPISKPITFCDDGILAIGCSDGAVRFYSTYEHKVIKSVRGPNGRLDPVVDVIPVNPWEYHHLDQIPIGDDVTMKALTICASGVAYLWEVTLTFTEIGHVASISLRPPLLKLDADRALAGAISVGGTNMQGTRYSKFKLRYEPDRQLLHWVIQSVASGTKKMNAIVWDLREAHIKSVIQSKSSETPIMNPCNIIRMPASLVSDQESFIVPAFMDPSFSTVAIMSLVVSKDGNIYVIGSRRGFTEKKKEHEEATVYYQYSFSSLKGTTDENLLGYMRFAESRYVSVIGVDCPLAHTSMLVVSTTSGIMIVDVNRKRSSYTGSLHAVVSIGRGDVGVISAVNTSLYLSSIDFTYIPQASNPVGNLTFMNPRLIHDSSLNLNSTNVPVRLPPRLLQSPSGDFICLFWHEEQTYEILHVLSLVSKSEVKKSSPIVDSGSNVLSFAWVGDNDVFAILLPPEMIKEEEEFNDGFTVKRNPKYPSMFDAISEPDEAADNPSSINPAKFKPRVELKVLVKVNAACATEFSDSIAAATATFLGTVTLRGRHPPTCLYGGPLLCISSLSEDSDVSRDGMSYFYSYRLEIDSSSSMKASNFVSVGPALPYPDMVVWDDYGQLCCFVIGPRIAIYLASETSFVFIGSAQLGSKADVSPCVQSVKFINGVLYCSTQTSVQAIFIGNLDGDNICQIESFPIASMAIPPKRLPHVVDPIWQQHVSLLCPSILGYFRGSLLVSNSSGVQCISLNQVLLRIGCLLSAGYTSKALQWLEQVHPSEQSKLKSFIDRWDRNPKSVALPN